jgi:GNAT superfamily N-acetyltransferase
MRASEGGLRLERVDSEQTRALRHQVLRPGMPYETTHFDDDDHPLAAHYALLLGGSQREDDVSEDSLLEELVVATGTVIPGPPPWDEDADGSWRIRGMATKEEFRGLGLGRRILDALLGHAAAYHGTMVWCHARIGALDFYRQAGFVPIGDLFDDGIAVHQSMWRTI